MSVRPYSAMVLALAGLTSIGLMAVVNFIIASDFKWMILSFVFPWALALTLYQTQRHVTKNTKAYLVGGSIGSQSMGFKMQDRLELLKLSDAAFR